MHISLTDARGIEEKHAEFYYEGGLGAFVSYLDRNKEALHAPPVTISGDREGVLVDVALQWNDSYHENMLCYTNTIPQRDGGTHLAGFSRGADAHHQRLCERTRRRQEAQARDHRR